MTILGLSRPLAGQQTAVALRGNSVVKRGIDLVGASLLLLLFLPLLVVGAAAVKLTSDGPVLFRQTRVGHDGASFTLLKLRSMSSACDDAAHRDYVTRLLTEPSPPDGGRSGVFKLVGDARVTRVGRFLRRFSIDELPQLINVLRGEMTLVGPRPALQWEVDLYERRHLVRLLVKPGLTGLWQVSGRSSLSMREALDLDVEYVRTASLRLDLIILVRTPWALLRSAAT